ncbi:hypothetical protein BJ138DRAFT_1118256 [Hygrophoropsis aurantiaca]|uniref:Uncharacterized protein n=1 Tax=Hygrophoropsis aurantiaca TaxID=72124 RepID=A0ACB7ZY10_9AGAM|nr:hypothetical protein BJ138DRAFT_1118256 [Hygrophoropsis aurantiaca]
MVGKKSSSIAKVKSAAVASGSKSKGGKKKAGESAELPAKAAMDLEQALPSLGSFVDTINADTKMAEDALIGYARIDVIDMKESISFGRWNPRDLKVAEAQQILDSFQTNGMDRFKYQHAIPICVNLSDIVQDTYQPKSTPYVYEDALKLPLMQLKTPAAGGADPIIYAAGGRHRSWAIDRYISIINQQIKDLVGEIEAEPNEEESFKEAKYAEALGIRKLNGQWLVLLYDYKKAVANNDKLGMYLSRNDRTYNYREGAEEGLYQAMKQMLSAHQTFRNVSTARLRSSTSAYKQAALLGQDFIFKMLETILSGDSIHYINADFFTLKRLHQDLFSPYGGILAFVVSQLERRLKQCFTTEEIDVDEVKRVAALMEKPMESEDWQVGVAARQKLLTRMERAQFVPDALTDKIRDIVDQAFLDNLAPREVSANFGMREDPTWSMGFQRYYESIEGAITNFISAQSSHPSYDNVNNDVKMAWQTCLPKIELVLQTTGDLDEPNGYPFMSASVWKVFSSNLRMISNSITEVSSWYSPFVHWSILGKWQPGSASADMLRALCAHQELKKGSIKSAQGHLVYSLLSLYPALLRMERQLSDLDIPQRPKTAKELGKMFGLTEGGDVLGLGTQKSAAAEEVADADDDNEEEEEDDDDDDEEDADAALETAKLFQEEMTALVKGMKDGPGKGSRKGKEPQRLNPAQKNWPVDFTDHWVRPHDLATGTERYSLCCPLLKAHTLDWTSFDPKSNARDRRIVALMGMAEYSIILHYREPLLDDSLGGAAHIRAVLERLHFNQMVQNTGVPNPIAGEPNTLTWPDRIAFDSARACEATFNLDTERGMFCWVRKQQEQTQWVQAIVNLVQRCPAAWRDGWLEMDPKTRPALAPEVHEAVMELVKAMEGNAFAHRSLNWPEVRMNPNDREAPQYMLDEDALDIVYRGTEEDPPPIVRPIAERALKSRPYNAKFRPSTYSNEKVARHERQEMRFSRRRDIENQESAANELDRDSDDERSPTPPPPRQVPVHSADAPLTPATEFEADASRDQNPPSTTSNHQEGMDSVDDPSRRQTNTQLLSEGEDLRRSSRDALASEDSFSLLSNDDSVRHASRRQVETQLFSGRRADDATPSPLVLFTSFFVPHIPDEELDRSFLSSSAAVAAALTSSAPRVSSSSHYSAQTRSKRPPSGSVSSSGTISPPRNAVASATSARRHIPGTVHQRKKPRNDRDFDVDNTGAGSSSRTAAARDLGQVDEAGDVDENDFDMSQLG